jgi:HipA-like protein
MSRRSEPGLRVLLHGEHVADLRQTRRGLTLTYREEITSSLGVGALCLSVALPVATRAYQGDLVLNWCEGLLPEGEMRTTLEQHFAVRRGGPFSLLAYSAGTVPAPSASPVTTKRPHVPDRRRQPSARTNSPTR